MKRPRRFAGHALSVVHSRLRRKFLLSGHLSSTPHAMGSRTSRFKLGVLCAPPVQHKLLDDYLVAPEVLWPL